MRIVDLEVRYRELPKGFDRGYDRKRKEFHSYPRIYIFTKGESIIENLENRRQRPATTYKKELLPKLIENIKPLQGAKIRWSQKAGCSCGCSPGFIVEIAKSFDIFVTVE